LVAGLNINTLRIGMLARDQIGDRGFIVGPVDRGLCERVAEPAVAVDHQVEIFRRTGK
jgi:hypothetical protein